MAQGLCGGLTSYETQSQQDIYNDIVKWMEFTNDTNGNITERITQLMSSGFWNKIPINFQVTILSTVRYFETIKADLALIKKAIEKDNVTKKEVVLLKKIGLMATDFNINYGKTYKEDLHSWADYNNTEFRVAERIYQEGRDYFVTLQDACNAANRLEDYMNQSQGNVVNIGGDVEQIQIQNGDNNRMYMGSNMDYDQVRIILNKIDALLESNKNQDNCMDEIKKVVLEAIEMVNEKETPSKIKKALDSVKSLANGVAENLVAAQIIQLLSILF